MGKLLFAPLAIFLTLGVHAQNFKFVDVTKEKLATTQDDFFPETQNILIQDDLGKLKYNIRADDNHIQISFSIEINYALIPSSYYEGLKSLYEEYF